MKTRILLIGGFLGAGKTTLLGEVARRLSLAGKRVGLITNDQAAELVDTAFLEYSDAPVAEVSGSCFCCNFPGFTAAIGHINADKPLDIIVSEPVGSCTDLSATILQPLKAKFAETLNVAPLSVLVDPKQLADILDGKIAGLHMSAVYIMRKQLEEADFIVINKTDLLKPEDAAALTKRAAEEWPWAKVFAISARSGAGIDGWLDEALQNNRAGARLAEVDYDVYAEGEAVLGWLNTSVKLKGEAVNWSEFAEGLLNALARRFAAIDAAVGHVKLLLKNGDGFVIGNVTGSQPAPSIRGLLGAGGEVAMTLNARAQLEPATLEVIVSEEIANACGDETQAEYLALKCLKPGRPNPTFRYDHVVA